ncbi:hypothetical protein [Streptomyces puniciscabiei]|uniref:hypothetical protein n=1 Tax=Streptomyces puniciscabiei TaxID=164348 RepID=UPI0006EBB809|nr:hypothetical protein [Streptomyces puniciscabiei]
MTPVPRAVTGSATVNASTRSRIERRFGHDVRHDQAVPAPARATAAPCGDDEPAQTASPGTAAPYPVQSGPRQNRPGASPGTTGRPAAHHPDGTGPPAGGAPGGAPQRTASAPDPAGPRTAPSPARIPEAPAADRFRTSHRAPAPGRPP